MGRKTYVLKSSKKDSVRQFECRNAVKVYREQSTVSIGKTYRLGSRTPYVLDKILLR